MEEDQPEVPRRRRLPPEERMRQILAAAMAEFVEKGYAATRIDDVAARAGLSKGGVYLHVKSKEELFRALIRAAIKPRVVDITARVTGGDASPLDALMMLVEGAFTMIADPAARSVLRLVLSEAPRFPDIAAFYHAEIVAPAMETVRGLIAAGVASGAFRPGPLTDAPQLVIAPVLVTGLWLMLFEERQPIDIAAMKAGHRAMLEGLLLP
jgi:AcrR family transcriptional regulator